MTDVVLPKALVPGAPENITDVWDNLVALRDKINGQLDLSNFVSTLQDLLIAPGTIVLSARPSTPVGYLICDGTPASRSTYAALFAAISTSFGNGDGSTTFGIPDLRGSVPVGKGTHGDVDNLGDHDAGAVATARLAVGSRKIKHAHSRGTLAVDSGGVHRHTIQGRDPGGPPGAPDASVYGTYYSDGYNSHAGQTGAGTGADEGAHAHSTSGTIGDTGGITDQIPFQVVAFFIKT